MVKIYEWVPRSHDFQDLILLCKVHWQNLIARLILKISYCKPIDWRWVGATLKCDDPPSVSLIQREPQFHKTIPQLQIYNSTK